MRGARARGPPKRSPASSTSSHVISMIREGADRVWMHVGRRERGCGRRRGGRDAPRPPCRSDTDELLEAVVAAGFGGVERAVRVHPRAVDAAGDKLSRRLALFPPAPDL